ncbi:hypothetical protein RCG24_20615 [Neobacillus sp. OS1-32]|uniref:hypothetical protein n=1 Tax=Neobacillus sp. OS1-32 TaxID=3070682 RepID=UPI0027DF73B0|nr:hypothetical protein [Neobacillus sp. OS1-32]WML30253.1 hypothetical protein RCG24_20615 [Neobacillus sp. OS1-32]
MDGNMELLRFGLLANKVTLYRMMVPQSVINELADAKRTMTTLQGDKRLGRIATNIVGMVDQLIEYATVLNGGNRYRASIIEGELQSKWLEIEAMIDALADEEGRQ